MVTRSDFFANHDDTFMMTTTPIDPPITVSITRKVKVGREAEFERLITAIADAAKDFPGHLGTNVFRPSGNSLEYRVIYKFDCMSHFHAWETSSIRADYYRQVALLLCAPPEIQMLTGLETWFNLPSYQGVLTPPPRYKMAITSWLAIYPLVILILECLNPILSHLPIPLRALIITLIAIPTMTYVLMPRMTKLCARWLYPKIPEQLGTVDK